MEKPIEREKMRRLINVRWAGRLAEEASGAGASDRRDLIIQMLGKTTALLVEDRRKFIGNICVKYPWIADEINDLCKVMSSNHAA